MAMKKQVMRVLIGSVVLWSLVAGYARARQVVVLFDVSGSMEESRHRNIMLENLNRVLTIIKGLDKGDAFTFYAFGGKRIQRVVSCEMPDKRGPMNKYIKTAREVLAKTLVSRLKRLDVDTRTTDIVGAVLAAERTFAESDDGNKELYIFSDMVDTTTWNMNRRIPEPSVVTVLPHLNGVKVEIVCLYEARPSVTTVKAELYIRKLRNFWLDYFQRTGAKRVEFRTM